jgi:uncharacterized protein (DUF2267 family)
MQHDRFVGLVQHRLGLPSRGSAERAIRSTLETLAERLEMSAADHLAAQLPPEIGLHLRRATLYDKLSIEEFFDRVARREDVQPFDSERHARVVLGVVAEAVSQGALRKVLNELPPEYRQLFDRTADVMWGDFVGAVH